MKELLMQYQIYGYNYLCNIKIPKSVILLSIDCACMKNILLPNNLMIFNVYHCFNKIYENKTNNIVLTTNNFFKKIP